MTADAPESALRHRWFVLLAGAVLGAVVFAVAARLMELVRPEVAGFAVVLLVVPVAVPAAVAGRRRAFRVVALITAALAAVVALAGALWLVPVVGSLLVARATPPSPPPGRRLLIVGSALVVLPVAVAWVRAPARDPDFAACLRRPVGQAEERELARVVEGYRGLDGYLAEPKIFAVDADPYAPAGERRQGMAALRRHPLVADVRDGAPSVCR